MSTQQQPKAPVSEDGDGGQEGGIWICITSASTKIQVMAAITCSSTQLVAPKERRQRLT